MFQAFLIGDDIYWGDLGNQQGSRLWMGWPHRCKACGFQFQYHSSEIGDIHPRGTICRPMGKIMRFQCIGKEEVKFESWLYYTLCFRRASSLHFSPHFLPTLLNNFGIRFSPNYWFLVLPISVPIWEIQIGLDLIEKHRESYFMVQSLARLSR